MELDITFSCQCGAFVDEIISCDGPDLTSMTDDASLREYWETITCDGCGAAYETHILSTFSDTTVCIPNTTDVTVDVRDLEDHAELVSDIDSTRQLEIYRKVTTDVVVLLRHQQPDSARATLNNMLYAQIVTAIEAYLSSSFIATVVNDDRLIRRLVETDPELAKRQFSLREIFERWNELKVTVAKYLKDLIFHDLKKVKPMFESVLDIDLGDVGWLFKAILIRHDCVHRNGFDKDGTQHVISADAIVNLVRQSAGLVSEIEQRLLSRPDVASIA
jgi:hypothetical protein